MLTNLFTLQSFPFDIWPCVFGCQVVHVRRSLPLTRHFSDVRYVNTQTTSRTCTQLSSFEQAGRSAVLLRCLDVFLGCCLENSFADIRLKRRIH